MRLTTASAPRHIIVAIQNVHALNEIVGDRITDPRFFTVHNFLLSELTADEKNQIDDSKGPDGVTLIKYSNTPRFKVAEKLDERRLIVSLAINGKPLTFQLDQARFFNTLTEAFGDDPIMTFDQLQERYDTSELDVLG